MMDDSNITISEYFTAVRIMDVFHYVLNCISTHGTHHPEDRSMVLNYTSCSGMENKKFVRSVFQFAQCHNMEPQFESRILPFHFGINPLATYAPMEYFAQHLDRSEREPIQSHVSVDRPSVAEVNHKKSNTEPTPSPNVTEPPPRIPVQTKTHSCYVCGKTLSSTSSYYVHMKKHSNNKPYHCPMCDVSFCRKPYLEAHMRTHTGERPFQCTVCSKRFTQKSSLNIHKRAHTGERPYSCEICSKRFAVKSYVDAHRWTHVFEKPLNCETCHIPFNSRTQYVLHMRSHSTALAYKCPCGRSFTKDSYLIRHQIKVHRSPARNSMLHSPEDTIIHSLPLTTVAAAVQEGMPQRVSSNLDKL